MVQETQSAPAAQIVYNNKGPEVWAFRAERDQIFADWHRQNYNGAEPAQQDSKKPTDPAPMIQVWMNDGVRDAMNARFEQYLAGVGDKVGLNVSYEDSQAGGKRLESTNGVSRVGVYALPGTTVSVRDASDHHYVTVSFSSSVTDTVAGEALSKLKRLAGVRELGLSNEYMVDALVDRALGIFPNQSYYKDTTPEDEEAAAKKVAEAATTRNVAEKVVASRKRRMYDSRLHLTTTDSGSRTVTFPVSGTPKLEELLISMKSILG
jgi:hypothetical protein